jgi:cytochrome P450
MTEVFEYDPFSPAAMSDPLPIYRVLRDHYPVYYSKQYDTFFLSRFADIWDCLSQGGNTFLGTEGTVVSRARLLAHNDGPVPDPPLAPFSHHAHGSPLYEAGRHAHGAPLRPGAVRKLEDFIRELARERLDELLPRSRFDLTQEYGGIVSASTICHLFRLPLDMAKDVLDSVNASSRTDEEGGFDMAAPRRLVSLIVPQVAQRRAERAGGVEGGRDGEGGETTAGSWPLVDGLIDFLLEGRQLSDLEVAMNLVCVMVGGTETLPKIVAHGLLELSRHPGQLAEVRADLPANCKVAIEEMNRFCGPAQWFLRTARKDTVIAGTTVRAGQRVAWLTQSAGRDPREFEDPDEFRWNRPIKRALAFGLGQHYCIGVHLAKLEGRVLLEEFLRRVTDFEVDLDAAVRYPSSFQWGYNELPVVIKAHE